MNDDELIKSVKEFVSIDDINKLCSLGYNKSVIRIYDGLDVIQNENELMEIHNLSRSILELQIRIDTLIDNIAKIK